MKDVKAYHRESWKQRVVGLGTIALAALLVLSTLTSCSGAAAQKRDSGTWTVCLYLCGSNLESRQSWATKTLEEIREAGVPKNATVVIQAGGAEEWHSDDVESNGTRLVAIGNELEAMEGAGEVSMGDASTLADFLAYCEEEYPADHTMVVLWDHGGGPLKGACYDETQHFDALDLAELDEALGAGVKSRGGVPYDIIGFDACLMGSLEVAITLADDAQYLVASEEIEAGAGWDYDPLLNAIKKKCAAADVAAAICDGYLDKCAERHKDAAATLSVVDLSKVAQVEQALDAALTGLVEEKGTEVAALRHLVFGTRYAETFGGSTKEEGRSNLVDLKSMAEGNVEGSADDGKAWNALIKAVDEAVIHRVCGSTTAGANGMSIWYPQAFDTSELKKYHEASPLASYVQTLSKLYENSVGEVEFGDAGSTANDGCLHVTIDPSTAEQFFDVYVVNEAEDGSYHDTNVDISDDWDNLSFSYNPSGAVAITLDGMVLDASVVSYENDYEVFSAPVTVDGEDANLRIAWIWDDNEPDGGHYELLGVWNGIDHVTGIADRSTDGLESGSTVGAVSLYTGDVREERVVGDEVVISEAPLAKGRYECHFVALDLMGNEYTSDTCVYEVDGEGEAKIVSVGGTTRT